MKCIPLLLAALALNLTSCISVTETRPDGTVVVTRGIDRDSVITTSQTLTALGGLLSQTSGKVPASGK